MGVASCCNRFIRKKDALVAWATGEYRTCSSCGHPGPVAGMMDRQDGPVCPGCLESTNNLEARSMMTTRLRGECNALRDRIGQLEQDVAAHQSARDATVEVALRGSQIAAQYLGQRDEAWADTKRLKEMLDQLCPATYAEWESVMVIDIHAYRAVEQERDEAVAKVARLQKKLAAIEPLARLTVDGGCCEGRDIEWTTEAKSLIPAARAALEGK